MWSSRSSIRHSISPNLNFAHDRSVWSRSIAADGSYGWGEGYGPATVVKAGVEFLAPLVVGEDPLQVEAIWNRMHFALALDYARRGVLVAAISAIDIALWDLRGKTAGSAGVGAAGVGGGGSMSMSTRPACTSSRQMI